MPFYKFKVKKIRVSFEKIAALQKESGGLPALRLLICNDAKNQEERESHVHLYDL